VSDAELLEELRAQAHMVNPAMWILDNEFLNENQQPIEFTAHRFMLQPYADSTPEQVIRKSAQVGWSILAILKSVHACKFLKLNVIYVLPTRNASAEFVTPKVNPMLKRNPVLEKMVRGTDNKSLKEIGDRWLYFRGAFNETEAISTSADVISADEYDRCNQDVLSMYQSRLQASRYRWFWRFSNPSLPGFGVDELFKRSDQMHWFITCPHCTYECWIDFEREFAFEDDDGTIWHTHYVKILNDQRDQEEAYYACGNCDGELDDDDRQSGNWQPKYPDRRMRGYWICQMMVPWVSATHIIIQKNSMTIDVFHNMVLGKAYQASEYLINREAILAGRRFDKPLVDQYFLGVDSGKVKHWVLGNHEGVLMYGTYAEWEEIEDLIKLYEAVTVIDALPDFTIPERLARAYPAQVFVHYYKHDSKSMDVSRRKESEDFGVIESDRTKLFDTLAMEITSGKLGFFLSAEALEGMIEHFENMYRVIETDSKQIQRARWETKGEGEGKRPDHWAHATAYMRVAQSFGLRPHEVGGVRPGGLQREKTTYAVQNDRAKVEDVMGMGMETLIERSLRKTRKKRL
jgi:hypothetical protein